ncbi:MAG: hypothetical protein NXH88_14940 [Hyphomonas sp.]|nr:hypothetical protein [Hyphomonas sp.]
MKLKRTITGFLVASACWLMPAQASEVFVDVENLADGRVYVDVKVIKNVLDPLKDMARGSGTGLDVGVIERTFNNARQECSQAALAFYSASELVDHLYQSQTGMRIALDGGGRPLASILASVKHFGSARPADLNDYQLASVEVASHAGCSAQVLDRVQRAITSGKVSYDAETDAWLRDAAAWHMNYMNLWGQFNLSASTGRKLF